MSSCRKNAPLVACLVETKLNVLAPVGLTVLVPEGADHLGSWWLRQRRGLDSEARPPFDSLVVWEAEDWVQNACWGLPNLVAKYSYHVIGQVLHPVARCLR